MKAAKQKPTAVRPVVGHTVSWQLSQMAFSLHGKFFGGREGEEVILAGRYETC